MPSTPRPLLLVTCTAMAWLGACNSPPSVLPPPPGGGPPYTLAPVGNAAALTGFTEVTLPRQLVVRATSNSVLREGVPVVWSSSGGSLSRTSTTTNAGGSAAISFTPGSEAGIYTVTARLEEWSEVAIEFTIKVFPSVTVELLGPPRRSAAAGVPMREQIELIVRHNGEPAGEIPVSWYAQQGLLHGSQVTTSPDGRVSTGFTPDSITGENRVMISVRGGPPVEVMIEGVAGPPARAHVLRGLVAVPVNFLTSDTVVAQLEDAFGNRVIGHKLEWQLSGGGELVAASQETDLEGRFFGLIKPPQQQGELQLTVAATGSDWQETWPLEVVAAAYVVKYRIRALTPMGLAFESRVNGSIPAVDTIPVGATMWWYLEAFDYEQHDVTVSLDGHPYQSVEFPYSLDSRVSITFTQPGTYLYRDSNFPWVQGTVVVTP